MGLEFDKLNKTNYEDWAPKMEALLEEKDLWEVGCLRVWACGRRNLCTVNKAFTKKQRLARAKIVLYMEVSQLPHTQISKNLKEVWDKLQRIHRSRGFGTLLAIRYHFFSMCKADSQSMQSWVADICHATYILSKADYVVAKIDMILALTQGLPNSYASLVVSLDATPINQLTFESVVIRLLNEETRQHPTATTTTATKNTVVKTEVKLEDDEALIASAAYRAGFKHAKKSGLMGVYCHHCGGIGHMRADCPSREVDIDAGRKGGAVT